MVHTSTAVLSPTSSSSERPASSVLDKRLKVSINASLIDKGTGDSSLYVKGFENRELTPSELAHEIDLGHAYCCHLSGTRRASNFICSDILSVDIDGTRRIEDLMLDPIVERCLTIFYTTPRHAPDHHRCRLVFALPRTVTSAKEMAAASRSLTLRLAGDCAATDAARLFFGSTGSHPHVFDRSIDNSLLNDLITQGLDADQTESKADPRRVTTVSRKRIKNDDLVKTAEGAVLRFSELNRNRSVHCPFHHDAHASAFIVESRAGVKGIHCSTCAQTFWPEEPSAGPHDFFQFENAAKRALDYFKQNQDRGPLLRQLFPSPNPVREGLTEAHIHISSDRYLKISELPLGLNFVKSPKGSGKTEVLRGLLGSNRTLLIGHRVALIRQSCNRLGLDCYADFSGPLNRERLGICLDSLQRLEIPKKGLSAFHTIVIDESEQVLAHLLGETLEDENRRQVFECFRSLVQRAKRVVALDADLGWTSYETFTKWANEKPWENGSKKQAKPSHIFLNEYPANGPVELFESDAQLLADLKQQLADKKRVFVTSNSKRRVDRVYAAVTDAVQGLKALLVTSETVKSSEARAFLTDPAAHALNYDAILTSPSLGTGVDIAFPESAVEVDSVYGFFETKITTHFDFDQQLGRVRHPGHVKVWISPRTYAFDTAKDVIKREVLEAHLFNSSLLYYDDVGKPVYAEDDPFVDLAAMVISQQRASKNNLKQHFIALKQHQGYSIEYIPTDDELTAQGDSLLELGRRLSDARFSEALIAAKTLRKGELTELSKKMSDNEEVSEDEKWSLKRTWIELFYREQISPQLIAADDRGTLRERVNRFEGLRALKKTNDLTGTDTRKALSFDPKSRFLKKSGDPVVCLQKLLCLTPLMQNGEWVAAAVLTKAQLATFSQQIVRHKPYVENLLGIEVRSDVRQKPMTQLNALLKTVGLRCVNRNKYKKGKRMIYPYALELRAFERMQELCHRRASRGAWESIYEAYGWDLKELRGEEWNFDANSGLWNITPANAA